MMRNPFSQAAQELIEKRNEWYRLMHARAWVLEYYDPKDIKLEASTRNTGASVSYHEAMSVMVQAMALTKPSKANMLAWIDARLEELTQ